MHPATGYSVATSLRLGPVVADAVLRGAGPAELRALVRSRRRRATLALLGLGPAGGAVAMLRLARLMAPADR